MAQYNSPGSLVLPSQAHQPQTLMTLPKAPATVLGDDPVARLNHRLIA
jgi:hypothetical protein